MAGIKTSNCKRVLVSHSDGSSGGDGGDGISAGNSGGGSGAGDSGGGSSAGTVPVAAVPRMVTDATGLGMVAVAVAAVVRMVAVATGLRRQIKPFSCLI